MRIVVCIKQVLDHATIRVSSRGELDTRDGVLVINAADLCALEAALTLRDAHGGDVIALTLGAPEAEDALREALAIGADRAILLNDALFDGSDARAVSYALAQAVRKIGEVDALLAGVASSDVCGGEVGPTMAELLAWPHITGAVCLEVAGKRATAVQSLEDGDRKISVPLPAVVTIARDSNTPRLAPVASIMNAYAVGALSTWSAEDIAADAARLGAAAALTVERRSLAPEAAAKGDLLTGTAREAAQALAARLRRRGFI